MITLPRTDRDEMLDACTCSPGVTCFACRRRRELDRLTVAMLAKWYPLLDAHAIHQQLNWPTGRGGHL